MKLSRSRDVILRPGEFIDDFMEGRLKVIQTKEGYRFSVDAIFLSEFATVKPGELVVDLGTGCGIILLVLLLTRPVAHAFGVEIQADLADQASRNMILNGFAHKTGIIRGDIKHPPIAPSSVDVVLCNPPYRSRDSGRINPDLQRAVARHEIMASINDILNAAARILRPRGRLATIYPAERLVDLMVGMRGFNLEPKRARIVHPGLHAGAKLALVESYKGGKGGLKILSPLIHSGHILT